MFLWLEEWQCRRCAKAMLSEELPQDRRCQECREFEDMFDEFLEQIISGVVIPEVGSDD